MKDMVFKGNVYVVDLGNTIGSVQGGVRPCVVISNDVNNMHSPTLQVIPFTSVEKSNLPMHYTLDAKGHKFLAYDSVVLTEQVTTIDKCQIKYYIGSLNKKDLNDIYSKLDIQFGKK